MKKTLLFAAISLATGTILNAQLRPQKIGQKKTTKFLKLTKETANPNLIYIQQADWINGSGVFVTAEGKGFYSADDFKLTETKEIKNIELLGYQIDDDLENTFLGASLYIYEDDNGVPAGIPGRGAAPVFSLVLENNSSKLQIEKVEELVYDFIVDTTGFTAQGGKTYWLLFAPKVNLTDQNDTTSMWNWFFTPDFTGADAKFVDADNFYGVGLINWYSLYAAYGAELGENLKGLCMALYDYNYLATDNVNLAKEITIFPNPASSEISVDAKNFSKATILDMTGKMVKTSAVSTIQISELPKGIYNLKIETRDGKAVLKKFIKK